MWRIGPVLKHCKVPKYYDQSCSSWDWGQTGIKFGTKHGIYNKSQQSIYRKRISMLTGLKVLSLTCKCVFYRPEHNAKGRPQGIEF